MKEQTPSSGAKHAMDRAMDTAGGLAGQAIAAFTGSAGAFVESMGIGDLFEIEAGRIAVYRCQSELVRETANRLIHDHTESSAKLKQVAGESGVSVPDSLDRRRESMIEHLQNAPTEDFDATYIDQQLMAHKEAVTLAHHFRDEGDDAALRSFAAELSPILENHLDQMKQLKST